MLKFILGLSLLLSSVGAFAEQCTFMEGLSPFQKEIAYNAYRSGYPYDLGYTMVAIAWKESRLGLYKVRYGTKENDRSFGIYHTVAMWKTKGLNAFEKGRWIQNIVENNAVSIQMGLSDLLYWKGRHNGDWAKMVGSYNGGNIPNKEYTKDVIGIMKSLRECDI